MFNCLKDIIKILPNSIWFPCIAVRSRKLIFPLKYIDRLACPIHNDTFKVLYD